jgi:starch synthase
MDGKTILHPVDIATACRTGIGVHQLISLMNNAKSKQKETIPNDLRVLFAASEVFPFVKTGGLADVACFLPLALKKLGYDIRIILPAYQTVLEQGHDIKLITDIATVETGALPVRLLHTSLPGSEIPVYLVDAPDLFSRPGNPYQGPDGADWIDNAERFALFNRVIKQICVGRPSLNWRPDILHCNDWHTGLAPALLSLEPRRPGIIFTIHNLAYQGLFPPETFSLLDLPEVLETPDSMEFYDQMSFMKGGLVYADQLVTVSPRYAHEITTSEFGCGLDGLLRYRIDNLAGILNGVNYDLWDPRYDPHIKQNFWSNRLSGKKINKQHLQRELGLQENANAILLGYIGRLVEQKGSDFIIDSMSKILDEEDVQLVMLTEGNAQEVQSLQGVAGNYVRQVAVHCEYNEVLAHRIQAGADILLMPSRFEPCGLTQLYALRYGTIPVVHYTGGLADTIIDATEFNLSNGSATGFQFKDESPEDFLSTIKRAVAIKRSSKSGWQRLMRTAMKQEFSWDKSAGQYSKLYQDCLADLLSQLNYSPHPSPLVSNGTEVPVGKGVNGWQ